MYNIYNVLTTPGNTLESVPLLENFLRCRFFFIRDFP